MAAYLTFNANISRSDSEATIQSNLTYIIVSENGLYMLHYIMLHNYTHTHIYIYIYMGAVRKSRSQIYELMRLLCFARLLKPASR